MSQAQELSGKVAVITGASRGIGFAIAEALASRGCSVVITARQQTSADEAAGKVAHLHGRAVGFECDVRNAQSIERLFSFVQQEFKHLDFLINNAGIYGPAVNFAETSIEGWRDAINVNLTGTFLCSKFALPLMKPGSVIVNNLSIAAYEVFPNSGAYIASKQGALGLTKAMREDLRSRGIRVIALVPGATDTEIWQQFWPEAPRQKMLQPKTVAGAVVNALLLPAEASVDEIRIMPASGKL